MYKANMHGISHVKHTHTHTHTHIHTHAHTHIHMHTYIYISRRASGLNMSEHILTIIVF